MEETIIMNEEDINEILKHNYWPCVELDIEKSIFIAKLYKYKVRSKKWGLLRTRRLKTAPEAWDYLKDTLTDTLKFVK